MVPAFIPRAMVRTTSPKRTRPQSLDVKVGDSLHEVDVHDRVRAACLHEVWNVLDTTG